MNPSLFIQIVFGALFLFSSASAQKKQLDHSVYDAWKSLKDISVSNDGRFVSAIIAPQEGDSALFLQDMKKKRSIKIERVSSYTLSPDGKYCVALVKAPFADRRKALIKKKKPEEMPKDSLVVLNSETFEVWKTGNVKSFQSPKEIASHIVYKIAPPTDTAKAIKKIEKATELLIIRNLRTNKEDTLRNAKMLVFNKFGNSLAVSIEPEKKDSLDKPCILFFDFKKGTQKRISNERAEYKSFAFDENGEQLVYLATKDTSKIEQKVFDVRYFRINSDSAVVIADKTASGLPEKWIFTDNAAPRFSKDGQRILIGSAPKQAPKDTTIVNFEVASLDVWSWKDPIIQPQQLIEAKRELNRVYTGIIYPGQPGKFYPIATEEMPNGRISDEGNGRFALLTSDLPYRIESQWDYTPKTDAWIWDSQTNNIRQIGKAIKGRPMLSPQGNYTCWWNGEEKAWFACDNRDGSTVNLTANIPVNFWDEKNDTPIIPGAYGIGAWGENDRFALIYDAFDIWLIDPKGLQKPENITRNAGRTDSITFRYINTDPEKRFIEPDDLLLLSAFNNKTKEYGYYTLKQKGRRPPEKRTTEKFTFSSLVKAKNRGEFVYQKSNFNTSPDLYVTSDFWKSQEKLTDINPQMRDYNWGAAELFSWTSFDGFPLQGIVYKPENFDPTKKYPVMIYFYEKHSDNLYQYFAPAPSRSTVNIPFFVSRGYIVFTPDIHYTVGHPGRDAYNSVVSGAEALAKNSWADKNNMAIQGQSWGGYQVAYLVTQTDLFKAAGAGAPVSNMTSAYGGIRWESGHSRQFQYEQTQSRIGSDMSSSLNLYIENSPVFFAKNVKTPLLIMHNDKDGAVPWYQGIEYFMTLRRLGKPVWMLQYNNEAHNLKERRNAKDLSIRLQQFFDHYLKGAPAPKWMTEGIPATEKGKTWGYELEEDQTH
ncbi:MAG: prolyl oligopeptidase family serine peptidase [Dysgonamonadaceae bacterium]|jgi:dipeptidyl aminopeptidase/acylaminoacyl peptidase|nr:prolyl oligopeptidase family serine peptidase [Dysgonamonadaceae bacterium]